MIQVGNCLDLAKALPDNSVDCIVTSPPYWGLRDYHAAGAIGLEPTFAEFVERLTLIFRELRRVLKPQGTCWINIGDAYSNIGKNGGSGGGKNYNSMVGGYSRQDRRQALPGLKPKELIGIPWEVAFSLRRDGWYLRSEIIWHVVGGKPESVKDRPTMAHQQIFLLTKRPHYLFDADAIAIPSSQKERERWARVTRTEPYNLKRSDRSHGQEPPGKTGVMVSPQARKAIAMKETKNSRTVWEFPNPGFSGGHSATFPPELPRRCIMAGCVGGGSRG